MNIGRRIRNLRLKKGLTQEELGERTDLTKGYISQIERDLSSPSIRPSSTSLRSLAVLRESFRRGKREQKVVYTDEDRTGSWRGARLHCSMACAQSNENEMELFH